MFCFFAPWISGLYIFFAQSIETRGGSAQNLETLNRELDGQILLREAQNSARSAVEAGFEVGTRTITDVLNLEHEIFVLNSRINVLEQKRSY